MLRGQIELLRIGGVKLTFNLTIRNDEAFTKLAKTYQAKLIEYFSYANSDYIKISPKPYLKLDINANRSGEYDPNNSINLTGFNIFDLGKKLNQVIKSIDIPEMYFKQNGELKLNAELARRSSRIVKTQSKALCIIPSIVEDPDNNMNYYEGVAFMINSVDNFCIISVTEAEYLCHELGKINMYNLSMQLINTYLLMEYNPKTESTKTNAVFSETKEEAPETVPLPKIVPPSTIPQDI